jgi:hypothetical protein
LVASSLFVLTVARSPASPAGAATASDTASCTPTHEISDGGAELRLRAQCPLSLPDTAAALDALFSEAFAGGRMQHGRASLELGRIIDYPWLSKSLADAALRSPVWDPKKGRGRRSEDNPAVASLIDTRRLLQPLAPTFARYGVKARAAGVEKVLVGRVGESEQLAALEAIPAAKDKKLPYDAILWVRLEKVTP